MSEKKLKNKRLLTSVAREARAGAPVIAIAQTKRRRERRRAEWREFIFVFFFSLALKVEERKGDIEALRE